MDIIVVESKGTGSTLLAAFDNALFHAGVFNYNLIILSSIIPPHSTITVKKSTNTSDSHFGHKLYVIKADCRSNQKGEVIGAALGWYQYQDGRGVFVEHETHGKSKREVCAQLITDVTDSIKDLCRFRGVTFDKKRVECVLSVMKVKEKPGCVLVLALYKAEPWD